ncbi:PKD domain-containing protein [Candidatus Pacearchaeota archaeon]|nr:PKD domain-containing protein [Candidatus Pacearchaeota archaeon]
MKKAVLFLLLILNCASVLGAVVVISENLPRTYQGGSLVQGDIYLNLTQEPAHQLLTSTFPGNSTLIDVLRAGNASEGVDFSCNIPGCAIDYIEDGLINGLSLSSSTGSAGFKLIRADRIEGVNLTISSSAAPSCSPQVLIDVLGRGEVILSTTRYLPEACGEKRLGCFNENAVLKQVQLTTDGVCEQITLDPAPAYRVGARITNTSQGLSVLEMSLLDQELRERGTCTLPRHNQTREELSCIIEQPLTRTGVYYVCAHATGSGTYTIEAEESSPVCGSAATRLGSGFSFDYGIHAQGLKYGAVNIPLAHAFAKESGRDLVQYLDDYLFERYSGNCSQGCYLPFVFSGTQQELVFSNSSISYSYEDNHLQDEAIYALKRTDALLTGQGVVLEIEHAGFTVPLLSTARTLDLFLGGRRFATIPINVTPGFEFDILPRFALIAVPTSFSILSSENITHTSWDFGDGSNMQASGRSAVHAYKNVSNYTLTVTATTARGYSRTKSFTVYSGNINESMQQLLRLSESRLQRAQAFMQAQPIWIRQALSTRLNLSELEYSITQIRQNASQTNREETQIALIEELLNLEIPESISAGKTGNLPLALGFSSIETDTIQSISKIRVPEDAQDEFRENLIYWIQQHYDSKVSFETIYLQRAGRQESLATHLTIILNKKMETPAETFFIIGYPQAELTFMQAYSSRELSDESGAATYLPLGTLNELQFLIPGEVDFVNLGMYPAPLVPVIGSYEQRTFTNPELPTGWLIFWIAVLVIGILAMYLVLQEWYKKRYESYLFKTSDELYNLINFIFNSRNTGLGDADIRKKLISQHWTGEQVTYAFKRLDGKRTGMLEIPLLRSFEQKKIRKEIASRQGGGDTRFIKRPLYRV